MHQLSSTDAQMLYIDSPRTPNHIAPLLLFDQSAVLGGKLRFRDTVAKVEQARQASGPSR